MKNLFIIFFLILVSNSFAQELSVNYDFPDKLAVGNTYTISVTILKHDFNGSAIYQQQLPEGITAVYNENKTGIFSFKDKVLQLSWHKLPKDSVFTFSYKIIVDKIQEKEFSTYGQFNYFIENIRGTVKTKTANIQLIAKIDNTPPSATAENKNATKPDATKPDATKPDATKPDATKPTTTVTTTDPPKNNNNDDEIIKFFNE